MPDAPRLMGLPRKHLDDHEEVLLDLHPHWWGFVKPIVVVIFALIGAVAVRDLAPPGRWPMLALLVVAVLGLVSLGVRYARWATTNLVLTTDRIIYRQGVLSKHGREIPLERVNDIACSQRLFERLIGAGDLLIESGGERGQQVISDVARPFRVQNEIYRAMEDAAARDAGRSAGGHALSVPEQIEKLDELRRRGVISKAEFDGKKSQLLDRL